MTLLKKPLRHLMAMAEKRPPGYIDDVLRHADHVEGDYYFISQEAWDKMVAKYAGTEPKREAPPVMPCPRCQSPMEGGCRRSCRRCGYAEGCGG